MRGRDLALVALINVVWAVNVLAVREAVAGVPPLTAAALRYAVVLVVTLPWLRWMPGRMATLAGAALAQGALWIALLNLSFARATDIASLSLVSQLGVPFSLLLAVLFLGERIGLVRSIAIAVALAGVVVIGFDPHLSDQGVAVLLSAGAAAMYAGGAILLRRLRSVPPFTLFAWIGLSAAPALLAASALFEPGALARLPHAPAGAIGAVVYSALLSSLVGHAGAAYLYGRYPVSTIAPLFIPSPMIAAALAVAVYGEPVTWRLVIGGALVVAASAVIARRTA